MAAPEYVPVKPMDDVRAYESPPRRPDPWCADRPGDFAGRQPLGDLLGAQGPDQGYALKLAHEVFGPRLKLDGVERADAIAGCVTVALKRASIFGRAPVAHDLGVAFGLWGFLEEDPPADLVELRRRVFAGVSHPHHYAEARAIADAVPESTLRLSHRRIGPSDWRSLIDVDSLERQGDHAPAGVGA
jgi:hypothetical protein